jgi:long-subunit fatty acid transport protein
MKTERRKAADGKDDTMDKSKRKTECGRSYGWALALPVLACLALPLSPKAQDGTVTGELVSLGKKTGVGARAMGMGEAFTAVADDYTALYYNPAGMSQLSRSEVGVNLSYGLTQNEAYIQGNGPSTGTLESTRLNALGMVLTDGGRWSLGLGYYSPVSFEDPLHYNARGSEYVYDASGRMDHFRLGLAYLLSNEVSLGLAVSAISGTEQVEIRDKSTVRYLEEYSGFNLEPSFLFHLSDFFTVGGSAVVVEHLSLLDTYQEKGGSPLETEYEIRHPFQAKFGIAFQSGLTQISADWHGDFWSSYSYREAGAPFVSHDVAYPNKNTFSIGLEQYLTERGPILRAGYSWENRDDRQPQPDVRDPYRLSVGLGLKPSRQIGLDLSYVYGGGSEIQNSLAGGPADLRINAEQQQVMASMRYKW